ncbi:MAG: hypothetical protein N3B01_01340 [Verrucomicrobiae bacterium]|nr:hypothetical protein [Verrucomicrobiae bacterium]
MKTAAKIFFGIAGCVLAGLAAAESRAATYVSVGVGYRSGCFLTPPCRPRCRVVYCPAPVVHVPRPVCYVVTPPPPPAIVVSRARPVTPPLTLADIKALAKAGVSDEVIISQIRNSKTVFRLTTAEIIDLTESGVSQRVIDALINTASGR